MDKEQQSQRDKRLLSPYRILDLSEDGALLCGRILSDLGADVIKIEKPGGDRTRNIGPFYYDIVNPEKSLFWFAYNTNKRGITLNVEKVDGQDIFKRLVKTADFVIESFSPGYMDTLGLSYLELSAINPRIIVVSITPFGQKGPYSHYRASDIEIHAMSGLMAQCGYPDRPPVQVGFPQSLLHASSDAAVGALIALYHREMTGEGQHVDVSAMESTLWPGTEVLPEWFFLNIDSKRVGHAFMRPNGLYTPVIWPCKDGYISFLLVAGLPGARANQRMVKWMESEGLASDYLKEKDWEGWDWETTTQEELNSVIEPFRDFFMRHTKSEIQVESVKRDISCYPINGADGTLADPQLKARNFWIDVFHDELNDSITYPGEFAKFSETPMEIRHRAPLIGEHNNEIYIDELGLSQEEIVVLKANGII